MKKLLSMLAISTLVVAFWACDDDDEPTNLAAPTVTAPSASNVQESTAKELSFTYTAAAGFKSSSVTATGGTAAITTDGTAGATSGTIVVTFTAGSALGAGSVTLTVVDNEDDNNNATAVLTITEEPAPVTVFDVTGNITTATTWETGNTYILKGRISVVGTTLTIEPGVVVKGAAGTGANATALLVARGAKLMAEGTAALPIIFTSIADDITPEDIAAGDFQSPNLTPDVDGLWGGLIVLGKARISASAAEIQIEGVPTSDANGLYGGTDDADNSGVIKYVSIRHGGSNIGSGNEINGLTLGGVGSGTVIDHVEVVGNQDDGIEWFGGTVNVTNAVVWNAGDDAMDTDQAWSGTCDNFVVITPGDHNFELDGPEGTFGVGDHDNDPLTPDQTIAIHTFKNGTVVASDLDLEIISNNLINTDANTGVIMKDIFFTSIESTVSNKQQINRQPIAGQLSYEGIVLNVAPADLDAHIAGTGVPAGITAAATSTAKANVTVLSWTWAAQSGALTGL